MRTEIQAAQGALRSIRRDPLGGPRAALLHGLYDGAWLAAGLLSAPWWLWRGAREPAFRRLLEERGGRCPVPPPTERPRVLIHGVSVGEIKGAASLVGRLTRERPDLDPVLSAITDTGLAMARQQYPGLEAIRFPFDQSWLVRRFLCELKPAAIVLIELEVWPNVLREANRMGIPVAVVNGRITERSFGRYRLLERLCPQFRRVSLFCAQTPAYAERFAGLGVPRERIRVTGNVKVDGLRVGRADPGDELRRLLGGREGQPLWVAGSTHAPEERWLVEAWAQGCRGARLVLVPRHPRRAAEICAELTAQGWPPQRLSDLRSGLEAPDPSRPALVDSIGELERIYGLADLVFVGGSLIPHGGQNLLEPAAQGIPVLHGPSMQNFLQEAQLLREAGASRQVGSGGELARAAAELLADPERCRTMGLAGKAAVERQQGATEATWRALSAFGVLPEARAGAGLSAPGIISRS
jgi:3-deoxy-D-manno-octulosonic-acid transferase